jgi:hypothetical protein
MTKHVHCDLIKAWAEGAQIQLKGADGSIWYDVANPTWNGNDSYRIKPSPPVTKYRWVYIGCTGKEDITIGWFSKEEINTWAKNCKATVIGKIAETKKIY